MSKKFAEQIIDSMVDENGHEEWVEAEIGDTIVMKATIKEHGEYKGTKQTVVTRPKIAEIRKGA